MTGEEQKLNREPEKSLVKVYREIGKCRGWKSISGEQYQVQNGVLYCLYVCFPFFGNWRMLKADLRCKPVVLDEIYWDVFHIAEEAKSQPFSFHIQGAFTAPSLYLPMWKEPLPSPEALTARLEEDIKAGRRGRNALERSLAYLPLYGSLNTERLDVSHLTPEEAAACLEALP